MNIDWKELGSRALGAVIGGVFAGLGAKAQGGTWGSAGGVAATTAIGMIGYGATHTTVAANTSGPVTGQ